MNRAERRLLAKAKGDPARAALMAKHRAQMGATAQQASGLAKAMHDEQDRRLQEDETDE